MSDITSEQRLFYFKYYITHGLTDGEATTACDLWEKISLDSPRRLWNDKKKEEEKDRETQEKCRKQFSPNPARQAMNIYETARKLSNKDNNPTLL